MVTAIDPYEGKTMKGAVTETWVRGRKVYSRDHGFNEKIGATGNLLLEPRKMKASTIRLISFLTFSLKNVKHSHIKGTKMNHRV